MTAAFSNELPEITFDNKCDRADGWVPEKGWNGLIPAVSTLSEAMERLGAWQGSSQLLNGVVYDFCEGTVRITVLEEEATIAKIWVSSSFQGGALIPQTIEAARELFGTLKATKLDVLQGEIFERPGLRITCDPAPPPEKVRSLEFYRPG